MTTRQSDARRGNSTAEVVMLLRTQRDEFLVPALLALFSFSILRAMEAIERAPAAGVRRAITYQVIEPLERGRAELVRSSARRGRRSERLLLPAWVVTLAERQLRALCAASRRPEFPWDELPAPLGTPTALRERLLRACGHTTSPVRRIAGSRGPVHL